MNKLVVAAALITLAACEGSREPRAEIPLPDLSRVTEPEIVAAVQAARAAVVSAPDSATAWGDYGQLLALHAWKNESIGCYREAGRLDPSEFRWPYLEGLALRDRDPLLAREGLKRALAIDDAYAPAHIHFARVSSELGQAELGVSHARRARELAPQSLDAALCLGQLLLQTGAVTESIEHLEAAQALDATQPEVQSALARATFALGDAGRSERHALAAQRHARRTGQTIDDPRGRPRASATGSRARSQVADAMLAQERYAEAAAVYAQVLDARPDFEPAVRGLAEALRSQGRKQEAIAVLQRGVEQLPLAAALHLRLVVLLGEVGRVEESERHAREAVRLRPDDGQALGLLGTVLAARGKQDEALERFRDALAVQPDEPTARKNLVRACLTAASQLLGTARSDEGAELLEEAAELAPEVPEPQRELAWWLATHPDAARRDGERALRLAERARRAPGGETVRGLDVVAAALAEVGRFDDAVSVLERALTGREDDPKLRPIAARRDLYRQRRPFRLELPPR